MKTDVIEALTTTFEGHAQHTEAGTEFWLARDLQHLLGYTERRNFLAIVSKAKTACEGSGHRVDHHFVDVNKMIQLAKGAEREVPDLMLTRYACYLVAQNGDPRKQEIAFAQTYFAIQTRRAELIEQRLLDAERVSARKKLSTTEKELSVVIYEQTGGHQDFALMDEVFGDENCVSIIASTKTAGQTAQMIAGVADFILWYAKSKEHAKFRALLQLKSFGGDGADKYRLAENEAGVRLPVSEFDDFDPSSERFRVLAHARGIICS